ncbi:MAG: hypothetical protein FJ388_04995, partial [Verrucomicrobia bacterium]|nr:hypothetical protein [Verrucomicrobiota bacterium]
PETHGLWNHSAADGIPTAVWTVEDNQGRRILWQWLEGRHFFNIGNLSVKERFKAGWDQAYSVPMLVSQRDDGTLALAPVPELEELRGAHFSQTAAKLPAGKSLTLRAGADANTGPATLLSPSVKKANGSDRSVAGPGCGAQQEVLVEIEPQPNAETGLRLTQAAEFAEIFYRAATSEMVLDFTKTAHGLTFPKKVMTFPLPLKPGEPLMLRVFLDGCLIEGFANGGRYFNARWYAPAPRDIQFSTFSRGADALLRRADVWTLKSATMTCQ